MMNIVIMVVFGILYCVLSKGLERFSETCEPATELWIKDKGCSLLFMILFFACLAVLVSVAMART